MSVTNRFATGGHACKVYAFNEGDRARLSARLDQAPPEGTPRLQCSKMEHRRNISLLHD
ncbi:hypothetical protein BURKHO8Y_60074 [Burkholderia sp. 8Y]|nr:hypothetical protein BURKHO8Y_60074 [Burkholderia sp. 8Y]